MIDKDSSIELIDNVINPMVEETKEQVYKKPHLTCFGDVRDITLGGSIAGGESLTSCIIGFEPGCNP